MSVRSEWQVQEAKSRLSELLTKAETSGPQAITRHGQRVAVVLSARDFDRLERRPKSSLRDFLARSPFADLRLDERDKKDKVREVDI